MLLYQGQVREEALRQQRVTQSELRAALRQNGFPDLAQVGAVVLETDGSFSVLPSRDAGAAWALHDVQGVAGRAAR